MTVVSSFNAAVKQAVDEGKLDRKKHGAAIAAGKKVASIMDEPTWPMVNGKLDNVSPSVFLKYCDALGILPDTKAAKLPEKDKGKTIQVSDLVAFRLRSKVANG